MTADYEMLAKIILRQVRDWPNETVAEFHERAAAFEDAGNDKPKAEFLAYWAVQRRRTRGELP